MTLAVLRATALARPAALRRLWRSLSRSAVVGLGSVLIVFGLIGTLLPWHLGLPVLVIGLIVVLRTSIQARRRFIGLQRKHPKIVFPIRRLLRREPEVLAVAWQQVLRVERLILPRRWRPARVVRRRLFRSRRRAGPASA